MEQSEIDKMTEHMPKVFVIDSFKPSIIGSLVVTITYLFDWFLQLVKL